MIRNETFTNGICIAAEIIDLDTKTYSREEMGVVVEGPRPLTAEEWLTYGPQPLDPLGSLTTLLVVEGVLPIDDAANAIHSTPEALIAEAEGWAAASE
jgi:hypothetical protein